MVVRIRKYRILLLSVVFIFLFQIFFNIKDFNILYVLSKAVIGALGLLAFGLYISQLGSSNKLPLHSSYLVILFIVLITIATLSSHVVFRQPYSQGLLSEIKLTAIFYYFLALFIFYVTKPDLYDIGKTLIYLGIASLVIYSLVNVLINPAHVWTKESSIVIKDSKGFRFRLPDVFIVIYLFYCLRNYLAGNRKNIMLSICLLIIAYLIFFQQQRAEFLSIMAIFMWRVFTKSSAFIKVLFSLVFIAAILFFVITPDISDLLSVDTSSLETRQVTAAITYKYVSSGFLSALFGAGNLNPLWNNGFARLYGENFFLSDIGWMGVIFEFGLIGAVFCLLTYILVLRDVEKTIRIYDAHILYALKDYILVRLILSILSPHVPYFIGIYMTILAISVYLRKRARTQA